MKWSILVLLMAFFLGGCEEERVVYLIANWHIRNDNGPDETPILAEGFNGDNAVEREEATPVFAECSYSPGTDGFSMSFSASIDGQSIRVTNARFTPEGNLKGTSSFLTLNLEGIDFGGATRGGISASAPSSATPCQIQQITVDREFAEGPSITIPLYCDNLFRSSQNISRDIVQVGSTDANPEPAILQFLWCDGLEPAGS